LKIESLIPNIKFESYLVFTLECSNINY